MGDAPQGFKVSENRAARAKNDAPKKGMANRFGGRTATKKRLNLCRGVSLRPTL